MTTREELISKRHYLTDIHANYDRYVAAIDTTLALLESVDMTPSIRPTAEPVAVQVERKKPAKAAKTPAKPHQKGPRINSTDAYLACLVLEQPFSSQQLAASSGGSQKSAESMITRWRSKGYVRRLGANQFERTAKFPAVKVPSAKAATGPTPGIIRPPTPPTTKRVSIPGLDEPELSLEQKLEQALAMRDKAVAEGNETMAQIQQDKVDKLEAELEAR